MTEKFLFVFDFDHTIVDSNSDTHVRDLVRDHKVRKCGSDENWTHYMQHIFQLLHEENVDAMQIKAAVETLSPTQDMEKLLLLLSHQSDCEVIILSDANSFFIEAWLEAHKVRHAISKIFTNEAYVDSTGALQINMFQSQDSCKLCEENLCKGHVLKTFVDQKLSQCSKFSRIFYVGDGRNDYCPCLKLSSSDVIFARIGYQLEKLLGSSDVKASVHKWHGAQDILPVVSKYLPSQL